MAVPDNECVKADKFIGWVREHSLLHASCTQACKSSRRVIAWGRPRRRKLQLIYVLPWLTIAVFVQAVCPKLVFVAHPLGKRAARGAVPIYVGRVPQTQGWKLCAVQARNDANFRSSSPRIGKLFAFGAFVSACVFKSIGLLRQYAKTTVSSAMRWYVKKMVKRRAKKAMSAFLSASLLAPSGAWVGQRYASRQQEKQAELITFGVFAVVFVWAFLNSRREDRVETERIRQEVQRLARLKKEFEDEEANDEFNDDSMAASLKAAQEQLAKEREEQKKRRNESPGDALGKEDHDTDSDEDA